MALSHLTGWGKEVFSVGLNKRRDNACHRVLHTSSLNTKLELYTQFFFYKSCRHRKWLAAGQPTTFFLPHRGFYHSHWKVFSFIARMSCRCISVDDTMFASSHKLTIFGLLSSLFVLQSLIFVLYSFLCRIRDHDDLEMNEPAVWCPFPSEPCAACYVVFIRDYNQLQQNVP